MTTFRDFLHRVLAGPAIKKIFGNIADELMQSIRDEHPDIRNETHLVELFYKEVKEKVIEAKGEWVDHPWIEASIKYMGFNTLAAQNSRERYRSPYWTEERKRAYAEGLAEGDEMFRKLTEIFIGDVVCPNGKTVKQNTGAYLSKVFMPGVGRIAEAAGDSVVEDVLSDDEIRKLERQDRKTRGRRKPETGRENRAE